jgi:multiple sugar transport system permease protein
MEQKTKTVKLKLSTRNTLVGLSFILPNFMGFLILILIPVIFSLVLSFMEWDGFNPMKFIMLENFITIFKDRVFRGAIWKTGYYSLFTVLLSLGASLGLAVLLNKKLMGKGFFRSAIFFPYVASIVAVSVVWNALFQKDFGPINGFLKMIGIAKPPGWTASVDWVIPALIIVSVWKNMGYFMIVYLAALQDIPYSLYEASTIDGANKRQQFFSITFPLLAPSTFFVLMMLTINSFKIFDLVYMMTEGGPGNASTMLSQYIYNQAFISWNYGKASAAAMILFLIVGTITVLQFRVEKKWISYM